MAIPMLLSSTTSTGREGHSSIISLITRVWPVEHSDLWMVELSRWSPKTAGYTGWPL